MRSTDPRTGGSEGLQSEAQAPGGRAGPSVGPPLDKRIGVRVRAPATSANLGPAFDAAGLALDWWDSLEAVPEGPGQPPTSIRVSGEQADAIPAGRSNLVLRAMRRLAGEVGAALPPLHLSLVKDFPLGRGFGSSAAAVALGLLAARTLLAPDLPDSAVLALATELEGHPDNVAPCLAGGAVLCWSEAGTVRSRAVPVHRELAAVALVAPEPMSTTQARRLLPAEVRFAAAARNVGRAALLPLALGGEFDLLLPATDDVLHQPARMAAAPRAARALELLRARGHAAFLSGAGPSLLLLCPRAARAGALADAQEALASSGAQGWRVRSVELARVGAHAEPA
jgi:homoserine kinase